MPATTAGDATASGGSNFGPTNQKLADRVTASIGKFKKDNPDYAGPVPADLMTRRATTWTTLQVGVSPAAIARVARLVASLRIGSTVGAPVH